MSKGEPCKRRRVENGGQNFYLVVGNTFIDATIPHENRPENIELRRIIDTLCLDVSALLAEPEEKTA